MILLILYRCIATSITNVSCERSFILVLYWLRLLQSTLKKQLNGRIKTSYSFSRGFFLTEQIKCRETAAFLEAYPGLRTNNSPAVWAGLIPIPSARQQRNRENNSSVRGRDCDANEQRRNEDYSQYHQFIHNDVAPGNEKGRVPPQQAIPFGIITDHLLILQVEN